MNKQKKWLGWLLGIFLVLTGLIACLGLFANPSLQLVDFATGKEIARFHLPNNNFTVSFVHSVNKSWVKEVYALKGKNVYLTSLNFSSFGAGMDTNFEPNLNFKLNPDGTMEVKGYNCKIADLVYVVGTQSDHILTIGSKEISLRALCGKNRAVLFKGKIF